MKQEYEEVRTRLISPPRKSALLLQRNYPRRRRGLSNYTTFFKPLDPNGFETAANIDT
jgi:hypothetical protein